MHPADHRTKLFSFGVYGLDFLMPSGLQNNIPDIFLKINVPSLTVISRKMFHVRLLSVRHKNLYGCELLTLNEKLLVSSFI